MGLAIISLNKPRSGLEPEWYCSAGNCVAAPPPWRGRDGAIAVVISFAIPDIARDQRSAAGLLVAAD